MYMDCIGGWNLELIFANAVESKIFIVNRIESATQDASLHFVVFVGQKLKFDVRITRSYIGVACR